MAKNAKSKKNVHNTKTAPNAHYLNKVVNKHKNIWILSQYLKAPNKGS